MYALFCIFCFHSANWHSPATLTEVSPCFFLSCKANARVYLAKMGHGPHSSLLVDCVVLCIVLCQLCCSMYCLCVNVYYCHQVSTQFQLNISYHIGFTHIDFITVILRTQQNLLSSSLLSKKLKIKTYRTIILPVVLYGCETWSLTLREEHGPWAEGV